MRAWIRQWLNDRGRHTQMAPLWPPLVSSTAPSAPTANIASATPMRQELSLFCSNPRVLSCQLSSARGCQPLRCNRRSCCNFCPAWCVPLRSPQAYSEDPNGSADQTPAGPPTTEQFRSRTTAIYPKSQKNTGPAGLTHSMEHRCLNSNPHRENVELLCNNEVGWQALSAL